MRGFAFLTDYNGKDKCQTDTIKCITPFKTGTSIIIALSIEININIKNMIHIELMTTLMKIAKLSEYIDILKFGISPTY